MSEFEEEPNLTGDSLERRCPNCDSVVASEADRCLMCGMALPVIRPELPDEVTETADTEAEFESQELEPEAEPVLEDSAEPEASEEGPEEAVEAPGPEPDVEDEVEPEAEVVLVERAAEPERPPLAMAAPKESVPARSGRPSWPTLIVTAVVLIFSFVAGSLVLRYPVPSRVVYLPTSTPVPPTPTFTPTASPSPTGTETPTETPTITLTPAPTDTPKPPRFHTVAASETLFGLGLFYGITADSIAEANGLPPGSGIQVAQNLIIPWPTATPPLVPIEVEVGGQTIIADPTDCEFYQIQEGDTLFGIASRSGVDLRAILAVNRLTDQVVLQPGDVLCMPVIIRNGVLPPTPGPSPTPTITPPPRGPQLLYPIQNAAVEPPEGPLVLQWAAVKDLAPEEWYMVEVTNLTMPDSHPMRGFTRRTAFRAPASWRPPVEESHLFRWRVSIVLVTGERLDGSFIYTFGGNRSENGFFSWLGAVPTPTPEPTNTPEPTRTPSPTPAS